MVQAVRIGRARGSGSSGSGEGPMVPIDWQVPYSRGQRRGRSDRKPLAGDSGRTADRYPTASTVVRGRPRRERKDAVLGSCPWCRRGDATGAATDGALVILRKPLACGERATAVEGPCSFWSNPTQWTTFSARVIRRWTRADESEYGTSLRYFLAVDDGGGGDALVYRVKRHQYHITRTDGDVLVSVDQKGRFADLAQLTPSGEDEGG